jgi:hypothetical protein
VLAQFRSVDTHVVMTLYDEIEPTPVALGKIKELPSDQPVIVISLLRMRTDLADGRAEAAWAEWQSKVTPLLREYGVTRVSVGQVLHDLIGTGAKWDMAGVYLYPNPKVLWKFVSDLRVIELMKVRRRAADDVNMLILRPTPVPEDTAH